MVIGSNLGNYNILGRLSSGGMGEVYLAEDTSLSRKVALKVLPSDWAGDSERLKRFQWEARTLAALNHPNIVTIFSVEQHEGAHFFTMELVEGKTLRDHIPAHGMSLDRFLELAVPLADALAAAHQRGIVHRDIKPGNVMVRHDDRLKVLDFGLAKREPGRALHFDENEPQSQDGRLMGTVAYMAPEQMAGRPIDHRADLYSLGVVFCEMLTGDRPFESSGWREEVEDRLLRNRELSGAELPQRLGELLLRCLEKDPTARTTTAEEIREVLDELRLELVSESFSSSRILRPALAPPRKRRLPAWLVIASTLLVVAIGSWSWWSVSGRSAWLGAAWTGASSAPSPAPQRIVVLPFQNLGADEDDYFAAGITEELTSRLASVGDLRVISRTTAQQYDRAGRTAREIGSDLGVDYLLEGTVRWTPDDGQGRKVRVSAQLVQVPDDTQLWSEQFDRGVDKVMDDILAVQGDVAEAVIRQLGLALPGPWSPRTRDPKAYQAYLRGMDYASRHNPTRDNWNLAVSMLERAVRLDPGYAVAWAELSRAHSFMYKQALDASPERLEKALDAATKALRLEPDLPDGRRALGYYYYWGLADYERALEEFAIAAERLPNDSPLLEAFAYIRRRQGRFEEAIGYFKEALARDPRSAWLASELANTYTRLRRYDEAAGYYELAINLAPDEILTYQAKAMNVLLWKGDLQEARDILDEMPRKDASGALYTRFRVEMMARNYDEALRHLNNISSDFLGLDTAVFPKSLPRGTAYYLMGDREAARTHFDISRRSMELKALEEPNDPRIHSALGLIYAGLGRREDALREGRRAIELYPVERDAFIGPEYLEHLAVIHAWLGEADAAIDLLEQVLEMPAHLSPTYLALHPRWDPLRGHPRFSSLIDATQLTAQD